MLAKLASVCREQGLQITVVTDWVTTKLYSLTLAAAIKKVPLSLVCLYKLMYCRLDAPYNHVIFKLWHINSDDSYSH